MRTLMIIITVILTIACLIIPFIYKKAVKPRIILHKLNSLMLLPAQLKIMYANETSGFKSKGKLIYALWVWFFATSDGANYFSSFDNLFDRSNMFILVILCVTLAIIADYSPGVICEYLFRDETIEISDTKKKIIKVAIVLMTIVILALISMLYILRFNIMNNVFADDVSTGAMKSMTAIWATLVLGSTIASFVFTAINKTIMVPLRKKLIDKIYLAYCDVFINSADSAIDELKESLNPEETVKPGDTPEDIAKDDIDRIHESNLRVIETEDALIRELYKVDKRKALKVVKNKHRSAFKNETEAMQDAK